MGGGLEENRVKVTVAPDEIGVIPFKGSAPPAFCCILTVSFQEIADECSDSFLVLSMSDSLSASLLSSEPKPFIDVSVITRFNQHSSVIQFK